MKTIRSIVQVCMYCVCLAVSLAVIAEQESIVVDPNGDYVFTYKSYLGWQKVTWIPATKINPAVRAIVRPVAGKPENLSYNYTVLNGKDSRQFLVGMRLSASNVLSTDPRKPEGWAGHATLDRAAGSGFIVGWFFRRSGGPWEAGLKPGASVSGIGLDSKDLPGVDKVALWGASPPGQSFPDEGPNEGPFRDKLLRIHDNDFVTRHSIVPRISVPTPYDAATVLTNIQKHLDTDLVNLKLVDPAFVAQLDPWFASAIGAARRNNTAALRNAIKELRRLLKQECADVEEEEHEQKEHKAGNDDKLVPPARIARLAARVLDFDLRYVGDRI